MSTTLLEREPGKTGLFVCKCISKLLEEKDKRFKMGSLQSTSSTRRKSEPRGWLEKNLQKGRARSNLPGGSSIDLASRSSRMGGGFLTDLRTNGSKCRGGGKNQKNGVVGDSEKLSRQGDGDKKLWKWGHRGDTDLARGTDIPRGEGF